MCKSWQAQFAKILETVTYETRKETNNTTKLIMFIHEQQEQDPLQMMNSSSSSSSPSKPSIPKRFLLEFSATKAPMNPEEIQLLRQGEKIMLQAKREALEYQPRKTEDVSQNTQKKKKSAIFSLQRRRSARVAPREMSHSRLE